MTESPASATRRPRWRIGLAWCFWLQLLIVPAFLGPAFYRLEANHPVPYSQLIAFLLMPACYMGTFAFLAARRAAGRPSSEKRSVVFAGVRRGLLFGVFFGVMAWMPFAFLSASDTHARWVARLPPGMPVPPSYWWERCFEIGVLTGMGVVHNAVLGAAVGGVVGLAVDGFARPTFLRRHLDEEQRALRC
jgi:hypothetical protein